MRRSQSYFMFLIVFAPMFNCYRPNDNQNGNEKDFREQNITVLCSGEIWVSTEYCYARGGVKVSYPAIVRLKWPTTLLRAHKWSDEVASTYGECAILSSYTLPVVFISRVLQSLWLPATWLRRHPLRGVDSVRLQILSVGTCRQWSVTGHNRKKVTGRGPTCANLHDIVLDPSRNGAGRNGATTYSSP